jgi:DNA polymerase III delta prime subunit
MHYARGTRFDPDKGCLPGTREMIIEEIIQWVNTPNGDDVPRIFLLSGVAGSGKSAIAHAIAELFDSQKRLGSSYCFDRADQVNRRPNNLLSTIALDIADLDHHWKTSLANIVKGNRSLRTTLSPSEQYKKFILEPAMALTTVGPILVVIDALDESAEAEEPSRKALLDTLAKGISDLPPNIRILITARPEPDIIGTFDGIRHILCKHMNTIDEASNKADITLFVERQLSDVLSLELEWPNKHWCQMLVESSGGLFQWASTACQAIKDRRGVFPPTERLSRFVSSARGLDALYSEVLRQAFDGQDDDAMSRFKLVMGRILATKEPLSICAHSELRSDDEPANLVELILPLLGSLLSGVEKQDIPIRPLHISFFDFLTDQNRSGTYYVDPSEQNRGLTSSCLRVMKSDLRFNIVGLETSDCRNADVHDLDTRIEATIVPHLSYGCCFWADHLRASTYDTDILCEVGEFFYHRFLYWLEVLSLMKKVNMASGMLLSVLDWNQVSQNAILNILPFTSNLTVLYSGQD